MHPKLLIELAEHIADPLTFLFKKTLQDGTLPADWKKAFVSPIFKKGARNLAANYRPISLTSILCKLMEKFVRNEIVEHLQTRQLLSSKQHGFMSGRSTTTQLLKYLDDCASIISAGGIVDSIYIDFQKAFHTVPHRRLLRKLNSYGIHGNLLNWIEGFLVGRSQEVQVNGLK